MPTNKTENYQLSQWVKSDQVRMEDFNADNAKIDAALNSLNTGKASASALSSLQSTVNGKASTSALNSLKTTVDGLKTSKADKSALDSLKTTVDGLKTSKADKSALDTLSATVSGHTTTLAKKGNVQLYTTTYTGNGQYGLNNPRSLTFPSQPWVVFIAGGNARLTIVRGVEYAANAMEIDLYRNTITWSGNSISWYHNGSGYAAGMMNDSGKTYRVVALLQAN